MQEEEDESGQHFKEVERLQEHGINAADISKLKAGGVHTVSALVMRTRKDLLAIKGITEAKVDKLLEAANKIVVSVRTCLLSSAELLFHHWRGDPEPAPSCGENYNWLQGTRRAPWWRD